MRITERRFIHSWRFCSFLLFYHTCLGLRWCSRWRGMEMAGSKAAFLCHWMQWTNMGCFAAIGWLTNSQARLLTASNPLLPSPNCTQFLITCHYSNCLGLIILQTVSKSLRCSQYASMSCSILAWVLVIGRVCSTRRQQLPSMSKYICDVSFFFQINSTSKHSFYFFIDLSC